MLQIRVEGGTEETAALVGVLRAAGVEVQVGTSKVRREGFTHTYAVVRLPDDAGEQRQPTVRVPSTSARALPPSF